MPLTHAQLLARALHARGVRFAFGMPGGDVLPLLDAFAEVGIRFVLLRHEGSAGFAAAAVYELTRSPGVAVSTLGPGATNLVSGAAGALLDRARVVCITGQASAHIRARSYTHQVLDQVALMKPVTLRSTDVDPDAGAMQILLAMRALDTQRPGPIHLDLSSTTAAATASMEVEDWRLQPKAPATAVPDVADAAARLRAARRPVVVVGCGDLSFPAANGVRRLVSALHAPALCTYKALGMADPDHPLYAGPMGLSPVVDRHQQALLAQADLLVAVGLDPVELRPDWLPGWPEALPILSVDPFGQPDLLGAVTALTGPTRDTLDALREAAFGEEGVSESSAWSEDELARHRGAWGAPFNDGPTGPASAVRAVQRAAPSNTRLCLDVGAHRITASHAWVCREPLGNLQSNGLCSMATGLPYGLASKLVDPDRPCIVLSGDMGLLMCAGELGAVVEQGLDLVVVVFLDASLSLIELKQERKELRGGGVRFANPDFVALAQAFGGHGVVVEGEDAVEEAVAEALAAGGLQVVGVRIDAQAYRRQM